MDDAIVRLATLVVATLSLCMNLYQGWLLRNTSSKATRREEIRTKLYEMKHTFEQSSLISTDPHYEVWEYGFRSLEEIREATSRCFVLVETTPAGRIPQEIASTIRQLFDEVKNLYRFRDSYTRYSEGKLITSQQALQLWTDFDHAKNALSTLQSDFRAKKQSIESYISSLY